MKSGNESVGPMPLRAIALVLLGGILLALPTSAATPPLVPFESTGDLFVMDEQCDCILRIAPDGSVSIEITEAQILSTFDPNDPNDPNDVDFDETGLAFDAAGALYFSEKRSDALFKQTQRGDNPFVLRSRSDLASDIGESSVSPHGIAFGSDGFLFVNEHSSNYVLRVDPVTGIASIFVSEATFLATSPPDPNSVSIDAGIVGAEGGILYVASHSDDYIYRVNGFEDVDFLAGTDPNDPNDPNSALASLDQYMTRAPNGDIIQVDDSTNQLFRITPAGVVTTFLSNAAIAAVVGGPPDLNGGIAFDSDGWFYLTEESTNSIYRFDPSLVGSLWVSEADIIAVTGEGSADLGAAIAFGAGATQVPALSREGLLFLSILLASAAMVVMGRRMF